MQVIARIARNEAVGRESMFAWESVAAKQKHSIFRALQAASSVDRKGKRASMMSASLPRQRDVRFGGRVPASLLGAPSALMACSGMRVVWGQGCALDETSGRARGGVGLRRHRHGDQERAERCAGAVPLLCGGCLWCPDAEPAT